MITAAANTALAQSIMKNAAAYTEGFGFGAKDGLDLLLTKIGVSAVEAAGMWMDRMAAANYMSLHHVYEWDQAGNPGGRLFDYDFVVSGNSVVFSGDMKQSQSIAKTADRPFYNKAFVMEEGAAVTISPKKSDVLVFESGGGTVFVTGSIEVDNPGGGNTVGQFQKYSQLFFGTYLRQSFLFDIMKQLETAKEFVAGWAAGAKGGGFNAGKAAGVKYISSPRMPVGNV